MKTKIISLRKYIGSYGMSASIYSDDKHVYLVDDKTNLEIVKVVK